MTRRKKPDNSTTLSALPARSSYEVGYAKPPETTRFQKGRSGNPKGRPNGAKTKAPDPNAERLKEIVFEEAYRMISVRDGARDVKVPMAQAIIRSLAVNAVKGNQRAQRLFAELLSTTERENRRLYDEFLEVVINYKVEWDCELRRRRMLGIVAPDPLPHPDHIHIDFHTGAVEIRGPMTKEEQANLYEKVRARKAGFEGDLEDLQRLLQEGCDFMEPDEIREEMRQIRRIVDALQNQLPE